MKFIITVLGLLLLIHITSGKPHAKELESTTTIKIPISKTLARLPVLPAAKVYQSTIELAIPVIANAYSGSLASWLLSLRNCESSGNYQENTGNGFYGAYQFTIDTWDHWNTSYARADLAPASVQDATIIKNTLATSGLSTQNPGCYAKEGLSNYPPND